MNAVEIRSANAEDVENIAEIMKAVWTESSISNERILGVLGDSAHSTMVAVCEGRVVGFVDGFLTVSQSGLKRWELDLLAVHPDFQRRGIASTLVTANTQEGQLMGAEIARGLIAVSNIGSQRAFSKSGYETDAVICELMVASDVKSPEGSDLDIEAAIIAVRTINYSGLWVEGNQNKAGLEKGLRQLSIGPYDLVGAVVPSEQTQNIVDAEALGFEKVGRYEWWQRPLKSVTESAIP